MEEGDGTTHHAPSRLHIYAGEPNRGLLDIYEIVCED